MGETDNGMSVSHYRNRMEDLKESEECTSIRACSTAFMPHWDKTCSAAVKKKGHI